MAGWDFLRCGSALPTGTAATRDIVVLSEPYARTLHEYGGFPELCRKLLYSVVFAVPVLRSQFHHGVTGSRLTPAGPLREPVALYSP